MIRVITATGEETTPGMEDVTGPSAVRVKAGTALVLPQPAAVGATRTSALVVQPVTEAPATGLAAWVGPTGTEVVLGPVTVRIAVPAVGRVARHRAHPTLAVLKPSFSAVLTGVGPAVSVMLGSLPSYKELE